jgi:hypothetical protein
MSSPKTETAWAVVRDMAAREEGAIWKLPRSRSGALGVVMADTVQRYESV